MTGFYDVADVTLEPLEVPVRQQSKIAQATVAMMSIQEQEYRRTPAGGMPEQ